jgi:hypothetical protein
LIDPHATPRRDRAAHAGLRSPDCLADPDDARGLEPLALLTDAQTALEDAGADLERIHDWVTELATSLHR